MFYKTHDYCTEVAALETFLTLLKCVANQEWQLMSEQEHNTTGKKRPAHSGPTPRL